MATEGKKTSISWLQIVLGTSVSLVIIALSWTTFYEIAELKVLDERFKMRNDLFGFIPMDPNIGTVDVDVETLGREGRWQDWTRDKHAKIVEILGDYDARMLGFDVFFPESSASLVPKEEVAKLRSFDRENILGLFRDYDEELRRAIEKNGSIYLAQYLEVADPHRQSLELVKQDMVERNPAQEEALAAMRSFYLEYPDANRSRITRTLNVEPPLNRLIEAAKGVGFAQTISDVDGTRRRYPLVMLYDEKLFPSLALIMVCNYLKVPLANIQVLKGSIRLPGAHFPDGRIKDIEIPISDNGTMHVNWAGRWKETFVHHPHAVLTHLREHQKVVDLLQAVKGVLAEDPKALRDPRRVVGQVRGDGEYDMDLIRSAYLTTVGAMQMERAVLRSNGERTASEFFKSMGVTPTEELVERFETVRLNNWVAGMLKQDGGVSVDHLLERSPQEDPDRVRRSYELVRSLLENGEVRSDSRPLYFYPPVRYEGKAFTPKDIKGKIYFYGLTATGTHDINPTPYQPDYPLVGIYPNVFNTILTENFITKASKSVNILIMLGLGLLMGVFISRLKALHGALIVGGLLIVYLVSAFLLFAKAGLWVDVVGPLGTLIIGYLTVTLYGYVIKEREKDFVQGAFGHYLAPAVIDQLMENPEMVDQLDVDIIAPMDLSTYSHAIHQPLSDEAWGRIEWAHRATEKACRKTGKRYWANVECFAYQPDGKGLTSAPWGRVARQIEIASQFAERLICFSFFGLMDSPTTSLPLGQQDAQTLYTAVQRHNAGCS